jgi:hypothetical protein
MIVKNIFLVKYKARKKHKIYIYLQLKNLVKHINYIYNKFIIYIYNLLLVENKIHY